MLPPTRPLTSEEKRQVQENRRDGGEKLESKLAHVVNAFRRAAMEQLITREEAEAAARKHAEEERIRRAKADVADKELSKLRKFECLAKQLQRAARLRSLANALEEAQVRIVEGDDDADDDESAGNELSQTQWLRQAADWLDPTMRRRWPQVDGADTPYWWYRYQQEMGAEPGWY